MADKTVAAHSRTEPAAIRTDGYDEHATRAITVDEVFEAIMAQLNRNRTPAAQAALS